VATASRRLRCRRSCGRGCRTRSSAGPSRRTCRRSALRGARRGFLDESRGETSVRTHREGARTPGGRDRVRNLPLLADPASNDRHSRRPGDRRASARRARGIREDGAPARRGSQRPVLLYLHGGPGASELPIARLYSSDPGRHFVVVHWDQRGAGASCAGTGWASLSLERIVADTTELGRKLAPGGKIFLVGHSWGSLVGVTAVPRRPDLLLGEGDCQPGRSTRRRGGHRRRNQPSGHRKSRPRRAPEEPRRRAATH